MNTNTLRYAIYAACVITILFQGALIYHLLVQDQNRGEVSLGTHQQADVNPTKKKKLKQGYEYSSSLNPFFSIEPLKTSLHPRYKLWTEMDAEEQNESLKQVGKYMTKYAKLIAPKGRPLHTLRSIKHGNCTFAEDVGKDGHILCGPRLNPPCNFISFGINDNPSFDIEIGNWGCRGFAGDPTVQHPSKLHENVTFHSIAATMLQDNEERLINKGGNVEWWYTSFPKLRYFLGIKTIDILKIDCEGCELHALTMLFVNISCNSLFF